MALSALGPYPGVSIPVRDSQSVQFWKPYEFSEKQSLRGDWVCLWTRNDLEAKRQKQIKGSGITSLSLF